MDRPPENSETLGAKLRAALYVVLIYILMPIWGLMFVIPSTLSRSWTTWTMKTYVRIVFWLLERLCGTKCELRGRFRPDHAWSQPSTNLSSMS